MTAEPFMLIDRGRLRAFARLAAAPGPFRPGPTGLDASGVAWLWAEAGGAVIGLTWLGPGHVWDTSWAEENRAKHDQSRSAMRAAGPESHQAEFRAVVSRLRLGGIAGRVLYAVHRAVLAHKTSLLALPDTWLAERVWGRAEGRPRHWRTVLADVLDGLTWVHVADPAPEGCRPAFGPGSVLLTHAGDLRGTEFDTCPEDCVARGHSHHHFQIEIGPGFLGLLERFGQDDGAGVRRYQFPVSGKRAAMSLRAAGKSGRLVSAFVPALLGEPRRCRTVGTGGHRILQALVRETTRPPKPQSGADPRAEAVTGGRVKTYSGRSMIGCALLGHDCPLVGFNGNGKRKGMGFRLTREWGWLGKAGYPADTIPAFLDDLANLAEPLHLTVVGVGPSNTFFTLSQLRGMAEDATGRRQLDRLDIRVFAPADYASRWSAYFGWADAAGRVADRPELDLRAEMRSRGLSCRGLAAAVGCDHSFLSRLLKGAKSWPPGLLEKVQRCVVAGRVGVPAG